MPITTIGLDIAKNVSRNTASTRLRSSSRRGSGVGCPLLRGMQNRVYLNYLP